MKYEVVNGLMTKDKYFEKGSIVTNKDIPQKSIKWLLEQNELIKIANVEKILYCARRMIVYDVSRLVIIIK